MSLPPMECIWLIAFLHLQGEYRRWKATMDADEVNLPFRTDLEEKAVKLEEFRNRNVTDVSVN